MRTGLSGCRMESCAEEAPPGPTRTSSPQHAASLLLFLLQINPQPNPVFLLSVFPKTGMGRTGHSFQAREKTLFALVWQEAAPSGADTFCLFRWEGIPSSSSLPPSHPATELHRGETEQAAPKPRTLCVCVWKTPVFHPDISVCARPPHPLEGRTS